MQETIKLRSMASLYVLHQNRILMLKRIGSRLFTKPMWVGMAGGHFEKEDYNNPYQCLLREINEEIGLAEEDFNDIQLKYVSIRCTNGEIRHNFYYFSTFKQLPEKLPESNEGEIHWVELSRLFDLDMPFTARECLKHYLSVGRYTDSIYSVVSTGIDRKAVAYFTELNEYQYS